MIDAEDYFIPESLFDRLAEVDQVMMEVSWEEMSNPFNVLSKAVMDETTLQDLLTASEFAEVDSFFLEEIGMSVAMYENLLPIVTSSIIQLTYFGMDTKSYEQEIGTQAEELGLSIGGLETLDEQLQFFREIPLEDQVTMLLESVREYEADKALFADLIEIYRAQDVDLMYDFMTDEMEEWGEFEKVLLIDRNMNWAELVHEQIHTSATLYAVGAGHLGGKTGLLQLLRDQGYELTPIN